MRLTFCFHTSWKTKCCCWWNVYPVHIIFTNELVITVVTMETVQHIVNRNCPRCPKFREKCPFPYRMYAMSVTTGLPVWWLYFHMLVLCCYVIHPQHLFAVVTSPARVVAKYCDECVCVSVCLSVCLSAVSSTGYIRNPTRDLYQIFVHVAYGRGLVLLRHIDDRPHRLSPERGWRECTARAKCNLRLPCCDLHCSYNAAAEASWQHINYYCT